MSNFFNKIDAPQLTSSEYGNDLAEMVDNINANFQKVFTLPFLKGDDGDMVTTEFSYFWDSANCLTQDGASIFNAIFCKEENPAFSEGLTHTDVKDILCDGGDSYTSAALNIFSKEENGYNPISLFDEVYAPGQYPKILMYYKIASETQTPTPLGAAQLYYYFDARVGKLSKFIKDSNSNTYKENFIDYTCILSTQYNTEGDSIAYKFVKQSGWPTLYFDDSSKQFCWQINGVRTGVNAQGVSGKDGRGTKIWLCQVTPAASKEDYELGMMIKFNIIKIWSNDEKGQPSWVEYDKMKSNAGPEENFLRKGDVVIGYLSDSTTTDKKDEDFTFDQILGVIDKEQSGGEFYVCSNLTQNTSNTFFNNHLYNMCSRIGSHEDEADAIMKGFIIPDGKTGNETGGHALYEGTFDEETKGLYLVHTSKIGNIQQGGKKITLEKIDGTPLNVYYNTSISGSVAVSNGMILSGNNPGAGGAWSNDKFIGVNTPLIINTDGASVTTSETLIIGPADIYCVDEEYKPTTLCINQRPGAEVVLGYNIMKVNDSGVGINTSPNPSYALNVGGDLGVTGSTTISSNLRVDGDATIGNSHSDSHLIKGSVQFNQSNATKDLTIHGNVLPGSDGKHNLGSSSLKWNNVYANAFQGNASSASKLALTRSVGYSVQPVYFSGNGIPVVCDKYAGGTRLNINSNSYTESGTIYTPTGPGNKGEMLMSNGSGAPYWLYAGMKHSYVGYADNVEGNKISYTVAEDKSGNNWMGIVVDGETIGDHGLQLKYLDSLNINFSTTRTEQFHNIDITFKNFIPGRTYIINSNFAVTTNHSDGHFNQGNWHVYCLWCSDDPINSYDISNGKTATCKPFESGIYVCTRDQGFTRIL